MSRRCGRGLCAAALSSALLTLGACGSDPSLTVTAPGTVPVDDAHGFSVTGARAGGRVTIVATTRDRDGRSWRSTAVFTADRRGEVSTATQAPVSGDYSGTHATGLVFSLRSHDPSDLAIDAHQHLVVHVEATESGRRSASVTQTREVVAPGLVVHRTDQQADGIVGTYYAPRHITPGTAAVVAFGGSEGGDGSSTIEAAALAAQGHPALALAYFGAPGLPDQLSEIPIEYFGTALTWLAHQPGVDRSPLVVTGGSRGSEAAILTALHYPQLVAGVIDTSPTAFAHASFPTPDGAAWTWQGRDVPYADSMGATQPDRSADFDLAAISSPILFVCGQDDHLWDSCGSSQRMMQESPGLPRTLLAEPDAGHFVDFVVPDLPLPSGTVDEPDRVEDVGGTVEADAVARLTDWPRLLAFLDGLGRTAP